MTRYVPSKTDGFQEWQEVHSDAEQGFDILGAMFWVQRLVWIGLAAGFFALVFWGSTYIITSVHNDTVYCALLPKP